MLKLPWQKDYPPGFPASERGKERESFDPALQHYARGFRLADPTFSNRSVEKYWHNARRQVIRHLLGVMSRLPQAKHLVLRGSLLLVAWLGDDAREPGDMDWVIRPASIGVTDSFTETLIGDIIAAVKATPLVSDVQILGSEIARTEIWLYSRSPGIRLVFPWTIPRFPIGTVDMDFVFGETLRTQPGMVMLPEPWSDGKPVLAASREESLAWKLLWLETDSFSLGKDLYDATLLAEQTELPWQLFNDVLRGSEEYAANRPVPRTTEFISQWYLYWEDFVQEYPLVYGEEIDWKARLIRALEPTFSGLD